MDKEGLVKIITNYFVELEKKQSAEQIAEVDKKGLWEADLKSVTFEELSNELADAILAGMGMSVERIYKIIRQVRNKKLTYGDLKTPLEEKDMDFYLAQTLANKFPNLVRWEKEGEK